MLTGKVAALPNSILVNWHSRVKSANCAIAQATSKTDPGERLFGEPQHALSQL